jgi:hypothetical protein
MNDRVLHVHEQIDRDGLGRHSNRVLHGHPSPTLWDGTSRTSPSCSDRNWDAPQSRILAISTPASRIA